MKPIQRNLMWVNNIKFNPYVLSQRHILSNTMRLFH